MGPRRVGRGWVGQAGQHQLQHLGSSVAHFLVPHEREKHKQVSRDAGPFLHLLRNQTANSSDMMLFMDVRARARKRERERERERESAFLPWNVTFPGAKNQSESQAHSKPYPLTTSAPPVCKRKPKTTAAILNKLNGQMYLEPRKNGRSNLSDVQVQCCLPSV